MRSASLVIPALGLATLIAACVGTDHVDDPAGPGRTFLTVTPASAAVPVGGSISFTATYLDRKGRAVTGAAVDWISSDESVAGIDASGKATGLAEGQTRITASADGLTSAEALLSVVADPSRVATVVVTPDSATIPPGGTAQLSASARNLAGDPIPGATFSWASDNPGVATVDGAGLVTGVASGSASITATSEGVAGLPARIEVAGRSRTGTFVSNQNTGYRVSGTATLRQDPAGLTLTLESDFVSSAGPGLHVFLSPGNYVDAGSLDLGTLRRTTGLQQYPVPAGVDLSDFDYVVIHCVPFNVTFGWARLGAPS